MTFLKKINWRDTRKVTSLEFGECYLTWTSRPPSKTGPALGEGDGVVLSAIFKMQADADTNDLRPKELHEKISVFIADTGAIFTAPHTTQHTLTEYSTTSKCFLCLILFQGFGNKIESHERGLGILLGCHLHWEPFADALANALSPKHFLLCGRCTFKLIQFDGLNNKVIVDGSNGVGGVKLKVLGSLLSALVIEVRNSSEDGGVLNDGVGADYVQKEKVAPHGFGSKDVGIRCASLDGDADRLVYFIVPPESSGRIDLVDGDKILSLFAVFIREQLSFLNENEGVTNSHQARLGVVQTAYANGASTNYLKQLGLEVNFTPTGVKYLHEKAAEFDIGIYFEANGHGTVLFSESFVGWLEAKTKEISSGSNGSEGKKAALRLLAVSKLINQAVGDALSGLLLVEVILQYMGWSVHRWNELYHDLPSRQLKVKVADRNAVITANAETVVVSPPGLQEAINAETGKYHKGRCFVRPSGTEDVVRVYAEASTQEAADTLANSVAKLVDQFLGLGSS
ncbi:Phosphoacetylglucosamine mutase [Vigna angularis]|uniref:Phosphoacetylglucosamine mutase n=1 Tax=Phaseolus angularis TaxID=3914 RepID=A0A8T0JJQ2_PHAAN|nr:Phosphoacetylglucosamine mutase [Vigna angularis]